MLAEHDFAILKFQRIGIARLGDGVNLGALGEIREDGMQIRVAEQSE